MAKSWISYLNGRAPVVKLTPPDTPVTLKAVKPFKKKGKRKVRRMESFRRPPRGDMASSFVQIASSGYDGSDEGTAEVRWRVLRHGMSIEIKTPFHDIMT